MSAKSPELLGVLSSRSHIGRLGHGPRTRGTGHETMRTSSGVARVFGWEFVDEPRTSRIDVPGGHGSVSGFGVVGSDGGARRVSSGSPR